jgi:hypothetical protein
MYFLIGTSAAFTYLIRQEKANLKDYINYSLNYRTAAQINLQHFDDITVEHL